MKKISMLTSLCAFVPAVALAQAPATEPTGDVQTAETMKPAETAAPAQQPAAAAAPAPKPAPYSVPWMLRPVAPGNVLKLDTVLAFASPGGGSQTTVPIMLLASYKVMPDLAVMVRWGMVSNSLAPADPNAASTSAIAMTNPVLAGLYGMKLSPDFKLGLFLGLALPLGSGGGNDLDADGLKARAALGAGVLARSAMDNAMFASNYLTIFPGAGLAYIKDGLTVQGEATILFLNRVRGDTVDKDALRVNMTAGLHLGYSIIPMLSAGADVRYQRFLVHDTLSAVDGNPLLDNMTFAVGPRFHFKLSETQWIRPGVAFALAFDKPMGLASDASQYKMIQIDVPFIF